MTKADLVEHVTTQIARTAGPMISKKDCARVVDSFLDAIKQALQEQRNIEGGGFGTFPSLGRGQRRVCPLRSRARAGRRARADPASGRRMKAAVHVRTAI